MDQQPLNDRPEATPPSAPKPAGWTAADTWLGLALTILLVVGYTLGLAGLGSGRNISLIYISTFEFILLIPIAVIFFWRKVNWVELG
ncbi:MAG: hypothetical protein KDD72_10650, partial [Anaerolineales bacterium]|nr:hypothetical protein [Anaerolineales bacterium]